MCTYRYDYNTGNTLKMYSYYERLDLYDRYITQLKPITKEQFDICRFKSGKYLFRNRDNSAYCTACDSHFEYIGGKHKEMIKCPQCGKEIQLHNTWRLKNRLPVWHDWYAFLDKIEGEENTVAIRYILTQHHTDGSITCQEDARVIWNVAIDDEIHYEWTYDPDYNKMNWRIQNAEYFNYYKGMTPNNYICTGAEWHDNYLALFQSLPVLANVNLKALEYEDFAEIAKYAELVEKLQKMGLQELAVNFLRKHSYDKSNIFDFSQTSAIKMMKITRNDLQLLMKNQTVEALKFLQKNPNCSEKEMENFLVFGEHGLDDITEKCKYYYIKRGKTINYIKNKVIPFGLSYTEYIDYLGLIDRLQYPIDNQYAYPKDFEKFKATIVERYNEMRERERNMSLKEKILEESKKDEKIHLISKALQESKELRKWFEGTDGLKVFVPESVSELLDAGVKMHNCLGNYANKILSNESLVMFIRRIDDTDDNYIAMEYAEGKIRQLREANERRVHDPKIIDFAEALVKKMNEIRVQETIVEGIIREAA